MKRLSLIAYCLVTFLGTGISNSEDGESKSVELSLFESYTITVPDGWKKIEGGEGYQIESAGGDVVFTATKYAAVEDGWDKFWKTRLRADFPTLKWSGKTEMVSHKDKDYRKHPFSILRRYEGKVMESEIVYYTVSINCGDFFVSGNFVGDAKSLPPDTTLPFSILKTIKPTTSNKAETATPRKPSD